MIPRSYRLEAAFDRAYAAHKAGGLKVIDAAGLALARAFGPSYRHNQHKLTVERLIRKGAADFNTRVEYGRIAEMWPATVDGAIVETERAYRSEVRERRHRQQYGLPSRSPAHEMRLAHARLFLRWFRMYGPPGTFFWVRDALTTSPAYQVAAE